VLLPDVGCLEFIKFPDEKVVFLRGVNESMKYPHVSREKKIKSFEALQTQPSPLASEKAATTHNVSSITLNIYLNIFIYLFGLLLKRCELVLLFRRGGVKAASGGPRKI